MFTLIPDSLIQGGEVLAENGKAKCCPFQQPFAIPHPQIKTQQMLAYKECGTFCVHFKLFPKSDDVPNSVAIVNCTGRSQSFPLEDAPAKGNIISM